MASCLWISYLLTIYTILRFLFDTKGNSPFPSVAPVWKNSVPNPCWNDVAIVRTQSHNVWCAPVIQKDLDVGYRILRIHEVYLFPEDQRVTRLFDSYVNTWLKIKQESDGWPSWTNALDDEDYITEFVSVGAKNYGYVTKKSKTVYRVRGFSLDVCGSLQLNYEVIKNNILEEILHPLNERRETSNVNPTHFMRDPLQKRIRTDTQIKKYGLVFDKRVLQPGTFKLYPYG